MTREEALRKVKGYLTDCLPADCYREAEEIIEALKQEPILDKIRAEIEQNAYPIVHGVNNQEKGMTLYGILQIIDKYKAESEEKGNDE